MSPPLAPRNALFDLAVNRARSYALRLNALDRAESERDLARRLELWYLRTRFAYRIPLEDVTVRLWNGPRGEAHWAGGPNGRWHQGPPPEP